MNKPNAICKHVKYIPLKDIRKKALVTNKDLLKINSDLFYDNLSGNEIKLELKKIHEDTEVEIEEIRARLKMSKKALDAVA